MWDAGRSGGLVQRAGFWMTRRVALEFGGVDRRDGDHRASKDGSTASPNGEVPNPPLPVGRALGAAGAVAQEVLRSRTRWAHRRRDRRRKTVVARPRSSRVDLARDPPGGYVEPSGRDPSGDAPRQSERPPASQGAGHRRGLADREMGVDRRLAPVLGSACQTRPFCGGVGRVRPARASEGRLQQDGPVFVGHRTRRAGFMPGSAGRS